MPRSYMLKMSFASVWSGNLHHLRTRVGGNCSYKFLRFHSGFYLGKVVDARTSKLQVLATQVDGKNQKSQKKRSCNINVNRHDGSVKSYSSKSTDKAELHEPEAVQCYNLHHISEKKGFDWPATVIVFDIETTGLSRQNERIIEIALRDLYGGKNSTFQTLVNPEKDVDNSYIHGITSNMVNRPDVPRFVDLVPILIQYIRSRQRDGKQVLLVAHSGRRFDVPFLIAEFQRCSVEIPEDWLFLDTLIIAQKFLVNPDGSKVKRSLEALRQYYGIPLVGPAHRAMQDVNTLSNVLQKMTCHLKLTIPELLDRGFHASDIPKADLRPQADSSKLNEE